MSTTFGVGGFGGFFSGSGGIGGAGGSGGGIRDAGVADSSFGCLANGKIPPSSCFGGKDDSSGSPWIVCSADCNEIWISANTDIDLGGMTTYHAVSICSSLGYTRLVDYGGNCGDVCGYCEVSGTSCLSHGREEFHHDGLISSGPDGPVIGFTVHWRCQR